jgi:sialic acid synthase SpsE
MIFAAEIGLNHDGNFELIYEMIRQAKLAGADVVKFQFGWRNKPDEINHFDYERVSRLKDWCDYWEVELLASIFTEEALDLAHHIRLERYKIASRTVLDNPQLCKRILSEGKETFVSVGMWDKEEFPFGPPDGQTLRYIYCRSKYPTYPQDMVNMPAYFTASNYYGYSDHLQGIEGCLLAIARGAQYVEKHFTLNKNSKVIRDHVLSATPDEFRQLTELGKPLGRLVKMIASGR